MSLTMAGSSGGGTTIGNSLLRPPRLQLQIHISRTRIKTLVTSAKSGGGSKKASGGSKTGSKFDSRNRRTPSTTTLKEDDVDDRMAQIRGGGFISDEINGVGAAAAGGSVVNADGVMMPQLPSLEEKDFWEGPQWDAFGFFVQYLWAFGIIFALVACGVAVGTYNEGATDFKKTPAYQESIQSREFLEEPEGSNVDVFESNPTEEAPNLE